MYLMLGMYGARAPREMYKEFLEAESDAMGLSGRPSTVSCCSRVPMILHFEGRTENRSLEDLVPDTGMRDRIESKAGARGYGGRS